MYMKESEVEETVDEKMKEALAPIRTQLKNMKDTPRQQTTKQRPDTKISTELKTIREQIVALQNKTNADDETAREQALQAKAAANDATKLRTELKTSNDAHVR